MKKDYYKIFYVTSLLSFLGFIIRVSVDYFVGDSTFFYGLIPIRILEFLVPGVISLVVGVYLKKHS